MFKSENVLNILCSSTTREKGRVGREWDERRVEFRQKGESGEKKREWDEENGKMR